MPRFYAGARFSPASVLRTLFRILVPGARRKVSNRKGRKTECRNLPHKAAQDAKLPSRSRVLQQEGVHGMMYPGGDPRVVSVAMSGEEDVDRGLEDVDLFLPGEDQEDSELHDYYLQTHFSEGSKMKQLSVIRDICQTTSVSELQAALDTLILDDWLGGIDALPGNIYFIAAFSNKSNVSFKGATKGFGAFVIFLIQLIGPPLMLYQYITGKGMEDHERFDWTKCRVSLDDFADHDRVTPKIIAFLLLTAFCLNALFVHLDERDAYLKVDRVFRILNYNGRMEDTSEFSMHLGAFMNAWVVVFVLLDTFLVLGVSKTVLGVLMDGMALAFLYNLDDIGSDMRLVDSDDWPGTQLSWLYENIDQAAQSFSDIDDVDPEPICVAWLNFIAMLLILLSTILPTAFLYTPFKAMRPDPYFETIESEEWLRIQLTQMVAANFTG